MTGITAPVEMTAEARLALENIGDGFIAQAFNRLSFAVSQRVGGDELKTRIRLVLADLAGARAALIELVDDPDAIQDWSEFTAPFKEARQHLEAGMATLAHVCAYPGNSTRFNEGRTEIARAFDDLVRGLNNFRNEAARVDLFWDGVYEKAAAKINANRKAAAESAALRERGPRISLLCLECGNAMRANRDGAPPGTDRIETEMCSLCDDGGGFPTEHYYALDGRELEPL